MEITPTRSDYVPDKDKLMQDMLFGILDVLSDWDELTLGTKSYLTKVKNEVIYAYPHLLR